MGDRMKFAQNANYVPEARLLANRRSCGEERDQILQAAPEAIDRPCHDQVEPAPGSVPVHGIETRTAIAALGAAEPLVDEMEGTAY
jgi:hypothetical protein